MSSSMQSIRDKVREHLEVAERIWTYEGSPNPLYPHARLTTGLCSNGFVDVGTVMKDPQYGKIRIDIANMMLEVLENTWKGTITRVVGADSSSTPLAIKIAEILGIDYIRMVKTAQKDQDWNPGNDPLTDNDVVLQVEDLITTSGSALKVREGIRTKHPEIFVSFAPFLPVVVDRSDPENRITQIEKSTVLPLLKLDIRTFTPSQCPYCQVGSKPIRPREDHNWTLLTRKRAS